MNRTICILGIAAALATALAGPADARAKRALDRIGGTEAGPIVGGLVANNGYYAYGPYYAPGLVGISGLYGPAYPVAPGCYLQRQRIWTTYGWVWRQAPICY
jgi:hypothetical protein